MLTVPLAEGGVSLNYVENNVYVMLHGASVNTGPDGDVHGAEGGVGGRDAGGCPPVPVAVPALPPEGAPCEEGCGGLEPEPGGPQDRRSQPNRQFKLKRCSHKCRWRIFSREMGKGLKS